MALESATYISDLVSTNPTGSDGKSTGDDHIRLVKSTVKATFPNVAGAVTPTHTELNFVDGVTSAIQTQLDAKAALASPALTGNPTAPTASPGDNDTSIATTAFVATSFAPIASPTFTGVPAAPTASVGTNTTQLATTAFVIAESFVSALPSQTGNAGKYVTTDGSTASWSHVFASGTVMLFAQTAAPTGWTKSVAHNDKALRVVSGTASSGGSTAFTTVFASRTPAGTITGDATTLTESQIPSHSHSTGGSSFGSGTFTPGASTALTSANAGNSGNTGGGGSHTHTASFSGTAMDFAVQYVDVIIATKD